jgi:hypothetical protein
LAFFLLFCGVENLGSSIQVGIETCQNRMYDLRITYDYHFLGVVLQGFFFPFGVSHLKMDSNNIAFYI